MFEDVITTLAKAWLKRVHTGRTETERNAYLEGVEDALVAVYGDTAQGVFPAHVAREQVEEIFFPDDE